MNASAAHSQDFSHNEAASTEPSTPTIDAIGWMCFPLVVAVMMVVLAPWSLSLPEANAVAQPQPVSTTTSTFE